MQSKTSQGKNWFTGLRQLLVGRGTQMQPQIRNIDNLESILAQYFDGEPSERNAFALFSDSWSSCFYTTEGERLTQGVFDGTNDPRIHWLASKVPLAGLSVLELGPLEAAHTVMLEHAGANVLAIEANIGAFLRCLVVKNQHGLNSKFLLGDFNELDTEKHQFDLLVASGVLYHMTRPVEFLEKFSACADKLFVWTHYFHDDLNKWNPALQQHLENGRWSYECPELVQFEGLTVKTIKHEYRESLGWSGFCGGTDQHSYWLERNDLFKLIEALGYSKIEIAYDDVSHQNGPALCLYAEK